jgi:hypothetical protein
MALAPARQAGGRGARIADFWRISAVFWLHTGIRIPWGAVHGSRLSVHGSWPAGGGSLPAAGAICPPVAGSRGVDHGQPVTARGSRLPDHGR